MLCFYYRHRHGFTEGAFGLGSELASDVLESGCGGRPLCVGGLSKLQCYVPFDRADVMCRAAFDITLGAPGWEYHECSK